MRSLEELREFFQHDRYATVTTGIEILEAGDGYAKVGLAVHEGHMNAGNRVMGAVCLQSGRGLCTDHVYAVEPDQFPHGCKGPVSDRGSARCSERQKGQLL